MTLSAGEDFEEVEASADMATFLGYAVKQAGGEIRFSRSELEALPPEQNFLIVDVEDEELVIRLVPANEVPVELGGTKGA